MKSRFSLLLAVALFVAPAMIIADETAPVTTEVKTVEVTTPVVIEPAATTPVTTVTTTPEAPVTTKTTETPATETPATEELSKEAKAGIFAAVTAFLAARRANVYSGLDTVGGYLPFNTILTKLASFDCLKGGKFEANIKPMNRVLVSAAAVAVVYAAYRAYVAQQDASEDFDADFDVDNN